MILCSRERYALSYYPKSLINEATEETLYIRQGCYDTYKLLENKILFRYGLHQSRLENGIFGCDDY